MMSSTSPLFSKTAMSAVVNLAREIEELTSDFIEYGGHEKYYWYSLAGCPFGN